eukprot:scaffold26372_cov155-Skeletonema_dohrnii-CCMP3373.AAC.2
MTAFEFLCLGLIGWDEREMDRRLMQYRFFPFASFFLHFHSSSKTPQPCRCGAGLRPPQHHKLDTTTANGSWCNFK